MANPLGFERRTSGCRLQESVADFIEGCVSKRMVQSIIWRLVDKLISSYGKYAEYLGKLDLSCSYYYLHLGITS